jgi:signal transduction histidine kinase
MRRDGLRLWAEGVLMPLYSDDEAHNGFSKIVRDATADYRDAEALRAAKEEAERANQAKDRFLAVLSHELRTPLSPIATAAHLLERTATVPAKYQNLLPMIQRNVALEARLIEDLLDLTAISAGKVSLKPRVIDMHELVQVVVDMLEGQLREKRSTCGCSWTRHAPRCRPTRRACSRCCGTCCATRSSSRREDGRIEVRSRIDGASFVLEVADSGIGIDAEALPRIFSAFEQADREVSQRFGGLGLGLAIAKGLVAEHKGELVASSAGRGKGATSRSSCAAMSSPTWPQHGGPAA